jgi:hypothetical protein
MNHSEYTPLWSWWMFAAALVLWLIVCLLFSFGFPSC